ADAVELRGLIDSLPRIDPSGFPSVSHRFPLAPLQVLDVVKLGELAAVVGRDELLEFFQGLVAEVAAVDEEEDAARPAELDEAVKEVDGGVRLATDDSHMYGCAGV